MKKLFTLLLFVGSLCADVLDVHFQFESWPVERDTLPVMLEISADTTLVEKRDPVQVLYVMDLSELTTGIVKREFVNGALKVADALGENDWFGVVLYAEFPRVLFPLSEMTESKKADLKKVMETISTEKGRDLSKVVQKISEQFSLKGVENTVSKEVVLTTTGELTGREKSSSVYAKLIALSKKSDLRLHTVSFGDDFDEDGMISLAEKSGGRAYFTRKREPESLFVAFDNLAYDIANPTVSTFSFDVECAPYVIQKWGDSAPLTTGLSFSTLPRGGKKYIFLQLTGDNSGSTQFDVNYSYRSLVNGSDISEVALSEVPAKKDEDRYRATAAPRMIKHSILSHLVQYDEHFHLGGKEYRREFCDAFKENVLFPLESAKGRIATEEMNRVYAEIELLWDQLSRSSNGDLDYVLKKMKYMLHSNKYGR